MTDEMGIERLKNEFREILGMQTDRVSIRTLKKKPAGSLALIEVNVKLPKATYYIEGADDTIPKATNEISFLIDVLDGFPRTKPHVYYYQNKILAHVNTFTSGSQCIDDWLYDEEHSGNNSSLAGTVQKTVMAIIHDPAVTRYDSMANGNLRKWQQEKTAAGEFPSCRINMLLKLDGNDTGMPAVPVKEAAATGKVRPAVPTRRGGIQ